MSEWLTRRMLARAGAAAAVLLGVFVLLEVGSLRRMTLTTDEHSHYAYGWRIVNFNSERFEESKMPFSALNALPRRLAAWLDPGWLRRRLETIEFGRYATVLCAVLLGWLVFRWARELYGPAAGLLALTLFVFDPNILTASGLVTTDLYAAWMVTLTVWAFWRFLNHEGSGVWRAATLSAVIFGVAQLAKYTSAYLAPILILIALGHTAPDLWGLVRAGAWRALAGRFVAFGKYVALYAGAFLVIVNAGYWGQATFRPLAGLEFRSRQFRSVQAALQPVPGLRVPVPWAYVQGLDWVLAKERSDRNNVYLLGQVGKDGVPGRRFPEYYAVAWLYKEPIATQLLLLAAIVAYAARFRRFDFRRNEWPLACTVLFFAWYLTFVFKTQKGFRFALVVLPLLFVFTGSLLRDAAAMGRRSRLLVGGLVLYLVVSVLSYYPHFLPYFNELVWDRTKAYRILADSNLGWGQNKWYLRRYQRRHPEAVLGPERPQTGTIVLSVNEYVGLWFSERYRWVRENFEPVGHIAHGHLIFHVTPEALRRVTDPVPADWQDRE
ncbi:MAG TPA: glycosyltransferase family 39 protein [Methylomirabilota bacterium]|nr:glycosyltransferase family 39 protein [Methylomirabilota bacterium]